MKSRLFEKISIIVLVVLAYMLQVTLVPYIELGTSAPNLLLIVAATTGFIWGSENGMLAGAVAGILWDMMFSDYMALYALIYISIGYAAGALSKVIFSTSKHVVYLVVFALDSAYAFVMYILFFLLRGRYLIFTYLFKNILPCAIYTALVSILIVPLIIKLRKIYSKIKDKENQFIA